MRMKKITAFLLAAALAMSLTACKKTTDDNTSGEEKTLTVFINGFLTPSEDQQFVKEDILPGFEQEYDCKVKMEVYSTADGKKSIQTQMSSNNVVTDVVMVHSGDMPGYVKEGWVEDITDFTKGLTDRTFTDAFTMSTVIDGKTYFVPTSSDVYLIAAKKDALKYLPEGADFNKLTYVQFVQFAVNAAKGEKKGVTVFPSLAGKNLLYEIGAMGLAYGADFPKLDGANMTQVWDLIKKFADNNAFVATQSTVADPNEMMKRGEALIGFGHMSPIGNLYQSAPEQYVIAAPPSGPKGIGSIGGAWGLGIVKNAKNAELGKKFIEYMSRPVVMYDYCVGLGGAVPPVNEVADKLKTEPQDIIMQKGLEVLKYGVISGVPSSDFTEWGAVKTLYENIFEGIVKNKTYKESDLTESEAKLDALRNK